MKNKLKKVLAFTASLSMCSSMLLNVPYGTFSLGLSAIAAEEDVQINKDNFPDETFRTYVDEKFDTTDDGILTAEEIAAVTEINVYNKGIADLKGVEYFTALKTLTCSYNNLISLDVSNNTALESLACFNNNLTSLDVSENTALTVLYCENNQLTSLDVSNNTALEYLSCDNNTYNISLQNGTFDLSTLPEGFNLDNASNWDNATIEGNVLTITDLGKPVTYEYNLGNEKTATFTLNFEAIEINDENFPDEVFRNYVKENYDTNQNGLLSATEISSVETIYVTEKSISDLKGIEYFTALIVLYCHKNNLTSLDLSKNTALTELDCDNNQLTSLNVSGNTALTNLYCSSNQLASLDVSNNTALTDLDCYNNPLLAVNGVSPSITDYHANPLLPYLTTASSVTLSDHGMVEGNISDLTNASIVDGAIVPTALPAEVTYTYDVDGENGDKTIACTMQFDIDVNETNFPDVDRL